MKVFTTIVSESSSLELSDADADTVALAFDDRKRGRLKIVTNKGESAGIQIERGHVLRNGSWLKSEDGALLKVNAKAEKITSAYIQDATLFAKACYHLGNRHVSLQIGEGMLRYQEDYVLDDMLRGLGVDVVHELAIFEPENGAYTRVHAGSEHNHGHVHDHGHRHGHSHGHHP